MRVALTLVALLVLAAPAQAAFPGANGRISFSSQGDLWSVAPDGSDLRRLTATPLEEAQSVFSPDGTRIAYRRRPADGAAFQLYVMDADGTNQRRVSASTVNETQPAWTPDGRRLVFRRSTPGDPNADVWTAELDGTGAQPLVASPGADERYPAPSPDGTRLAFTSSRDGQYELYVAGADGAGPTRLTSDPGYDSAPSWSPDSARLAFERGDRLDADTTKDVWLMPADGSGQVRLTADDDVVDEGPAFSPDGTQIAFTSARDHDGPGPGAPGDYEIYRMADDGSGQARVLALGTKEESPDWQALSVAASPPTGPGGPQPGPAPPGEPAPPGGPTAPGSPAAPDGPMAPSGPSAPGSLATPGGPAAPPPAVPADRDRDGLAAGRERALGTSDLDRDSDDDGLSDRRELLSSRTSPRRADSDGDRLPDGVELGVTRPVADPTGPPRGTARSRFRPDADPRTRTDPRRADTDRDGRADGREDANRNGRRDRGESDPRRR